LAGTSGGPGTRILGVPGRGRRLDLMFADAAGWRRGAGGHAAALGTIEHARQQRVRRLVPAHIGRPTIRGLRPVGRFRTAR